MGEMRTETCRASVEAQRGEQNRDEGAVVVSGPSLPPALVEHSLGILRGAPAHLTLLLAARKGTDVLLEFGVLLERSLGELCPAAADWTLDAGTATAASCVVPRLGGEIVEDHAALVGVRAGGAGMVKGLVREEA